MNTCAAGALVTERSKRGSIWRPRTRGISICTGGSSARSSESGRAAGLRSARAPQLGERSPARPRSAAPPSRTRPASSRTAVEAVSLTWRAAGRAGFLSIFGCISRTSRSPFFCSTATESETTGKRAVRTGAPTGTTAPSITASLRPGEGDHRLQPGIRPARRARGASPRRAVASDPACLGRAPLPAPERTQEQCRRQTPDVLSHGPVSSSCLLTPRTAPPSPEKQAIT